MRVVAIVLGRDLEPSTATRACSTRSAIGMRQMVPPNVATTIGATINFAFSIAALLAQLRASSSTRSPTPPRRWSRSCPPSSSMRAHLAPAPTGRSHRASWSSEVLGFSVKNQVGWLADLVNFQTDKVVIALAVDVRAAALRDRLPGRDGGAQAAILTVSAMIPTAAARIVERGPRGGRGLYRRYTLRSCAIAFPLALGRRHRPVPARRLARPSPRRLGAAGALPHPRLRGQPHHRRRLDDRDRGRAPRHGLRQLAADRGDERRLHRRPGAPVRPLGGRRRAPSWRSRSAASSSPPNSCACSSCRCATSSPGSRRPPCSPSPSRSRRRRWR